MARYPPAGAASPPRGTSARVWPVLKLPPRMLTVAWERRALVHVDVLDDLGDEPVEIGVPLAVRMRHHVDGNAVHGDGDVRPVVGVEAAQKDLLRLAASSVLRNQEARREPQQFLGRLPGSEPHVELSDQS